MLDPALYFFGWVMLATLAVAVLLCHYRAVRQKPISWGTVFSSSVIANVSVFLVLGICEKGWHIFSREAWTGKAGLSHGLIVLPVIIILYLLPALGVAVYYQKRSKRVETHVA